MAHNIVLLNLGDRADGGGLIHKSADRLRTKYPAKKSFLHAGNQISEVSMFALFGKSQTGGALKRSDVELQQVRGLCASASKIMLCLHGLHNDVLSGFANDSMNAGPMAAVATFGALAQLTLAFLTIREDPYNRARIICVQVLSADLLIPERPDDSPHRRHRI